MQSLTKAALDEEEADRDAAVQDVVSALGGNAEGHALESLRSEVDSLVQELRVEVTVGAVQEHEAQQVSSACIQSVAMSDVVYIRLYGNRDKKLDCLMHHNVS